MPEPRAQVRNAADPQQVKRAARKEREREALFFDALQATLRTPAGRLVFAEILDRAGLYASVFDHSGSVMTFKEGRRNFGLEVRAWIEQADETLAEQMDAERRARARADNRAMDAAHTASAEEQATHG